MFINICRFGIASRQQESGVDLLGHWPIDERSFSISFQGSEKPGRGEKLWTTKENDRTDLESLLGIDLISRESP